jgi:hypothetical protein
VVETVAALLVISGVMAAIQFAGPAILDNDGYYHIRWSRLLTEEAPSLPEFKWLPLTVLSPEDYADHHFLYHVLLAPFTSGDLRLGAKLSAVVFSSLGLTAIFSLLIAYRTPYRWLWLVPLIGGSSPFLYRMAMTRAPALSLLFLGIGCHLILRRKAAWLAILSFLFTWSYSLFPLILFFAGAYTAAVYVVERRLYLKPVWASLAGVAAGLIVNPYFPNNVELFGKHVLMKYAPEYVVDVGVEWYPYETWTFVETSAVAFAVYFIALVLFNRRDKSFPAASIMFLIVSALFLLLALKSRRFVEYWPPFAVLFAAFAAGSELREWVGAWPKSSRDRLVKGAVAALLCGSMIVGVAANIINAYQDVKTEADPFAYRGAAEWLAANTPKGAMVFNTDWDDFPMLFYYNTHNTYVAGLDPTYLHDRDPELWNLYARVTLGEEPDPAPIIRDRFGAEYVFTDNDHDAFIDHAISSGDFKTVYSDRFATVLRIIN